MADAMEEITQHLMRISLKTYMTADGEAAQVLLGDLALMLGIGVEIGANQALQSAETRRMHAALRTVLQMSIDGWRWKASQAKILHGAAELAYVAFKAYPALGISMLPGACALAESVRLGTASMRDVVGVEIYSEKREEIAA